ncbi:MAG TPA: GntR family transcriptional regulator [Candidatus Dormibacteraeota bacterium]|nr:GntR family transcriptional regulator [Candidatus Dormibacteraeota bacterium]
MRTKAPAAGQSTLAEIVNQARTQYKTIGDMAYSVIRQAILSGVLAPGQHLRQDLLAESLGISRIPVRSALFQLESDGLVELRPHRGAVVRALTVRQIDEIYDIRIQLESHALRLAIVGMTPERLRRLTSLARHVDDENPGDRFVDTRIAFYRELYDAAQNPLLVSMIERLRSDVGRYWLRRRIVGREPGHRRLLEYVTAGDANAAVAWLQQHLHEVAGELRVLVEHGGHGDAE